MSMVDETRSLFQDILAPDLKALSARLDAVNDRVSALETVLKDGLATTVRTLKEAFAMSERLATARQDKFEVMLALNEKVASARHELLATRLEQAVNALQAHHDSIVAALQLDRRMERVERSTSALERISGPTGEGLAKSA